MKSKTDQAVPRVGKAENAEVPLNARPAILFGFAVLIVTIGGFGSWAGTAPLSSAVIAEGSVKVDTNRKKVQHLEGGIVDELLVRNGDRVAVGDVLVRLDRTRAEASATIYGGKLDAARAGLARLTAERDGQAQLQFPPDLVERSNDAAVRQTLEGERRMFQARRETLAGQVQMAEERIGQLGEEIIGLQSQVSAKKRQISLIKKELVDLKDLLARGLTPRARVLALEREAARLEGERGEHIAGIARAKRTISESRMEIMQLETAFREQVVAELRERQDEVYDLAERVEAARFTLAQTEIAATEDGIVVGLDVHTVGGVIKPGDTLMEIVPLEDRLIVEARVRPQDVDEVQLGLQADVNFVGFSQRTTPKASGEVIYQSADALTDPKTGESHFLVRVAVPETEVARLGTLDLQPGMPAQVLIQTGRRTPFEYLLRPIKDSMAVAWREQ